MSSNIPSVAASIPTNVPDFLTFIETSIRSVLHSIVESHNIIVPSKSVLDVIRNSISDHLSSGACLGSSLLSCTILNSVEDSERDENNHDTDFPLSRDLRIYILSRTRHKLKLRPSRRILLQNSVDHNRNGITR